MGKNLLSLLELSLSKISLNLVSKNPIWDENEVHYAKGTEGEIILFVDSANFDRVREHLENDCELKELENKYGGCLFSISTKKWYL